MQKSVASLYTNKEQGERQIKKQPHLQMHPKKKKIRNKFNQGGKRPRQ